MGSQLGITTREKSSSCAITKPLPTKVVQEADDYCTAKRESFHRLAVMQMQSKQSEDGALEGAEDSSEGSKWDIVRKRVSDRNNEFLQSLLQSDSVGDVDQGQVAELATQKTVLVEE